MKVLIDTIKSYLLIVFSCVMILLIQGQTYHNKAKIHPSISLNDIKHYRSLIRVNQRPIDMQAETMMMCAMPQDVLGPHYSPGIVYYINQTAKKGIKTFPNHKLFPVGSLIVKEKQERKTEDSVKIITVMKKVRAGRGENTWNYKMYDAQKWSEVSPSQQANGPTCLGCHQRYKANDYISNKGMSILRGEKSNFPL